MRRRRGSAGLDRRTRFGGRASIGVGVPGRRRDAAGELGKDRYPQARHLGVVGDVVQPHEVLTRSMRSGAVPSLWIWKLWRGLSP